MTYNNHLKQPKNDIVITVCSRTIWPRKYYTSHCCILECKTLTSPLVSVRMQAIFTWCVVSQSCSQIVTMTDLQMANKLAVPLRLSHAPASMAFVLIRETYQHEQDENGLILQTFTCMLHICFNLYFKLCNLVKILLRSYGNHKDWVTWMESLTIVNIG